jgi:DNA-binding MarR family transcriptional regulator
MTRPSDPQDVTPVRHLVGYQLRRAHTLFALHWQLRFRGKQIRVTPMQGGMLMTIEKFPGLTQTALAKQMEVEGPTLLEALDRLQQNGLVRRVRRAEDRRAYALELTDLGREIIEDVKHFVPEREEELLADLSVEERETLISLLQRIVRRSQSVLAAAAQSSTPVAGTPVADAPVAEAPVADAPVIATPAE